MPSPPLGFGRYELIAEIGRGGMAEVKLAIQRGPSGFEKLVVLKLLHEELASDKSVVEMLTDEAKLSALIKHPNVIEVYELGEEAGRHYIAMEYLEGESLLSILDKCASGKKLDPLSTARVVADTAEGLDA
ncbi:MAG: protein kinase, partial [Deltaproteobacteria bacterium]|nr:protein kinase [Deltaproteobacteria bacterium]